MRELKTLESSYDMTIIESLMSQSKMTNVLQNYLRDEMSYFVSETESDFNRYYEGLITKYNIELKSSFKMEKFLHHFGGVMSKAKNEEEIAVLSVNTAKKVLEKARDMIKRLSKVI